MADDDGTLSGDQLAEIVHKKATCPFLGTAVATYRLPVHGDASNPLASIEDVRRLGNDGRGGRGDLGDLLVLFAAGNHAFMRGASGQLDQRVPADKFSLELPGSQGSHAGHSGILQGDPKQLASGRFSADNLDRLLNRAQNALITRSDVAHFIAENIRRDQNSRVLGEPLSEETLRGVVASVVDAGRSLVRRLLGPREDADVALRDLHIQLTKLAGQDNLIGSAGEFGLLFAFFTNNPDAQQVGDEPALWVNDVRALFEQKRFPDRWDTWPKTWDDWVKHTTALVHGARRALGRSATA